LILPKVELKKETARFLLLIKINYAQNSTPTPKQSIAGYVILETTYTILE